MQYNYSLRTLLLCGFILLGMFGAGQPAVFAQGVYQSANRVVHSDKGCLLFICGSITNEARAVDTDPATAATIVPPAALSEASLRLSFPKPVPPGNQAGIMLSAPGGLAVNLLNTAGFRLYMDNGRTVTAGPSYDLSSLLSLGMPANALVQIDFTSSMEFNQIEVYSGSVLSVGQTINLHYAYGYATPTGPLPVELVNFQGKALNGAVELNWQTASEKNSHYFAIERADKGGEFKAIGQLNAQGNSSTVRKYQYRDAEAAAYPANTQLYYRLRQVDVDGTENVSPVVAATTAGPAGGAALVIYPSIVTAATAEVTVQGAAAGHQILLYDLYGRLHHRAAVAGAQSRLAVPALPAGHYVAVLQDAAGRSLGRQRLVVEK